MRIGQTSLVVFLSKLVSSALGFLGTIYFARVLGAEVLGLYALIIAVVAWLKLGGSMGVGTAVTKRVSEGDEQGAYVAAGALSTLAIGGVVSVLLLLGREYLSAYVGEFDAYVAVSVVWFVLALLAIKLFYKLVLAVLEGERKVHLAGLLAPVQIGVATLVQIALVIAGFSLVGLLIGYGVGGVLIGVLGLLYVSTSLERPRKRHFRSLYEYAKYAWLGGLKSRSFNDVDVLVLGAFVPSALVGVYAVAWSIAKFLDLFGTAVSDTLFPEISRATADGEDATASQLVEDSLAYGGLIVVPGLVGGLLLGDRLLAIYGPEFVQGTAVLGLLLLATLLYGYQKQLLTALNAVDRPDLAFRINLAFIAINAVLNVLLVWRIGWTGAAIATAISAGIGLALAYAALTDVLAFRTPIREIGRQWVSAGLMGGGVWFVLQLVGTAEVGNLVAVPAVVAFGAGLYFATLLGISRQFRRTVRRNLPLLTGR